MLLSAQMHHDYRFEDEATARECKAWFDAHVLKRPRQPKRLPGLPYGPERTEIEREMAGMETGLRVEMPDPLTVRVHYTLDSTDGLTVAMMAKKDNAGLEDILLRKYGIPKSGVKLEWPPKGHMR